jgi:hypothetical protein
MGVATGCETDPRDPLPTCIAFDADACTPLYVPTFERVHSETLVPRCGVPGGFCHGEPEGDGAVGGLFISDPAVTHAMLLGEGEFDPFVEPGDPSCSPLMVRLNVEDAALMMPPGEQPLPADERCSIAQWIAQGAPP